MNCAPRTIAPLGAAPRPAALRHQDPARWAVGFWSLIVTQFQGAFNDNALKFLVIYLVVDLGLPQQQRDWLVLVVGALFALPFILFSMTGGFLADRYSKRSVTIATKFLELAAMSFALVALARGSFLLETIGVFVISSQAALFGPSKYGLLPEILPEKDLSWGNGVIELGTFLAAISATVASGYLAFYFRGKQEWSGVFLLGCTVLGLAASLGISRGARGQSLAQIQRQSSGRSLRADWRDSCRSGPALGIRGQHVSVVPGRLTAIHDRRLRS